MDLIVIAVMTGAAWLITGDWWAVALISGVGSGMLLHRQIEGWFRHRAAAHYVALAADRQEVTDVAERVGFATLVSRVPGWFPLWMVLVAHRHTATGPLCKHATLRFTRAAAVRVITAAQAAHEHHQEQR